MPGYLLLVFFTLYLIYLIQIIPRCIGLAMILHRTEKGSWRAFVPFRSSYVGFRLAGRRAWFVVDLVLWQISVFVPAFALISVLATGFLIIGAGDSAAYQDLYRLILLLPFAVVALLRFLAHTVRSLGIGARLDLPRWLRLGMVFLPGVFYPIAGSIYSPRDPDRAPRNASGD